MRISLKVGATVYPLAGTSGVDERVHSSAGDFRISAESEQELIRLVRAATARMVDRGNLATTISFSTTRLFLTAAEAFLYTLDHDAALPRAGILLMSVTTPAGAQYLRHLMDVVISPPVRRVIGCTALMEYQATGGGIVDAGYIAAPVVSRGVTGTLSPDATGALLTVTAPAAVVFGNGPQWSTDGAATRPGAGVWKELYQAYLVTPSSTTVNALAPKEGYTATGSQSTASKITVNSPAFSNLRVYWLYDDAGTARWVLTSDGALASRDSETIPTGDIVYPTVTPTGRFVGGVGATWQDSGSASWLWLLKFWTGGSNTGNWTGIGNQPNTATWSPFGAATGTPTVT